MVDGDDGEEFPTKLTRVALMVIMYLMLMFSVYLLLMFILYLMLIFIVYLMLGAIKWSMRCLVNMCEQDISIDFCRVRGASCTHALTPSYKYNAALSQ